MNLVMALDNDSSEQMERLAPHKSMIDINTPRALTNNARFPKPVASTIASWIHSSDETVITKEQEKFLQALV